MSEKTQASNENRRGGFVLREGSRPFFCACGVSDKKCCARYAMSAASPFCCLKMAYTGITYALYSSSGQSSKSPTPMGFPIMHGDRTNLPQVGRHFGLTLTHRVTT